MNDFIGILIAYIAPVLVGSFIVRVLAAFILRRILLSWPIIPIVLSTAITIMVTPKYAVWVPVMVTVLFIVLEVRSYWHGPGKLGSVIYLGAYSLGAETASLRRPASTVSWESKFLSAFQHDFATLPSTKLLSMPFVDYRPPRLIYMLMNEDHIDAFARKLVRDNCVCFYCIIDIDGHLDHISSFPGNSREVAVTLETCPIFRTTSLGNPADIAIQLSTVIALGSASELNANGRWRDALYCAGRARQALERINSTAAESARSQIEPIIRFLMPFAIRNQALALYSAGRFEDAVQRFFEALKLTPHWPLRSSEEYHHYYRAKYTEELMQGDLMTSYLEPSRFTELTPTYSILSNLDYLYEAVIAVEDKSEDYKEQLVGQFASLQALYPNSPWISMYWADVLRLFHITVDASGAQISSIPTSQSDLLKVIAKYEEAVTIDPSIAILSSRLAVLYMHATLQSDPDNRTHLSDRLSYHMRASLAYYESSIPDAILSIDETADKSSD